MLDSVVKSDILERLKDVASIEQIEEDQEKLRKEISDRTDKFESSIAEIWRQINALEVFRKTLVTARDGIQASSSLHKQRKPRRVSSQEAIMPPQEPSSEPQSEASELPELPELTAPADGRSMTPREQIIDLLRANPKGLTCGQISHAVKITYQGTYQNLNNGTGPEHFIKDGTLYRLKNQ